MRKNLITAFWFTIVTTFLFGVFYPLGMTGLAQILFPERANGQLLKKDGTIVGSRIVGQLFSGPGYFHSRPSSAGTGYDATSSGGSNLAPTNKSLLERVRGDVEKAHAENPLTPVPVDLVTASGSGLDPEISPAAAEFQVPTVAKERAISEAELRSIVLEFTRNRQFGVLGEPGVNVLELNLELDRKHAVPQRVVQGHGAL